MTKAMYLTDLSKNCVEIIIENGIGIKDNKLYDWKQANAMNHIENAIKKYWNLSKDKKTFSVIITLKNDIPVLSMESEIIRAYCRGVSQDIKVKIIRPE